MLELQQISRTGYEHNPEPEIQDFDEMEDKAKVEKKLEDLCEKN